MTDNDLIKLFFPLIKTAMTTYGYPVTMRQSYQPTQQGAETGASLYFYKVGDKRIGHPKRQSEWDIASAKFVDTDVQRMETTFQVTALVRQIPATTTTQPTASDYINIAAMYMQSREFINMIQADGVAITKIGDIRNPYFKDDKNQFEASPSFDFTLIHNRSLIRDGRGIESVEFNIRGIPFAYNSLMRGFDSYQWQTFDNGTFGA